MVQYLLMATSKLATGILVIALGFLPSCKEKPKNPVAEYGDALIGGYKRSQEVAKDANIAAIQEAVKAYRAVNGEFPRDLRDVESLAGVSIDPVLYNYDPNSGSVTPAAGK